MNAPRVELITQAEYARRRGVAKSAVAKAVKEGRIVLIDGKIDPAVADIQWSANTRARADSGRTGASNGLGSGLGAQGTIESRSDTENGIGRPAYNDARSLREQAEAEMAQRANLRDAGKLLDRAPVERGIFDVVRSMRDAVMTVGQRAAPKCIGLSESREIERVITDENRKALENFEARLLALLPPKEST